MHVDRRGGFRVCLTFFAFRNIFTLPRVEKSFLPGLCSGLVSPNQAKIRSSTELLYALFFVPQLCMLFSACFAFLPATHFSILSLWKSLSAFLLRSELSSQSSHRTVSLDGTYLGGHLIDALITQHY